MCDGYFNCPDLTDECLCPSSNRPEICDRLEWGVTDNIQRPVPYLQCMESHNKINVSMEIACDNKTSCGYFVNEKNCKDMNGYTSAHCQRVQTRENFRYVSCHYVTDDTSATTCISDNLHCKILQNNYMFKEFPSNSSRRWIVCDVGNFANEFNCYTSYRCMHIPYENVSTAQSCTRQVVAGKETICDCTYFRCDDEIGKHIQTNAVCDGHKDCPSGIDECQPGCIVSAFSDETSLITDKAVLVLAWFLSIFAIVGCIWVTATTFRDLVKATRKAATTSRGNINKLLILSLSVSDLMVAIYTISICIKAVQVEGSYCSVDIEWRTSKACSMLGALLVIGSEQSVLTMVLITIYRLHAVVRPLSKPECQKAIMVVAISWLISILFGLIPLTPSSEDYFLKFVSFNDTVIFKTKLNQTDRDRVNNWLGLMNNSTNHKDADSGTEWNKLRTLIARMNPDIRAVHEFGYYSSHTVCFPTLFPDREDKSFMYSLVLLLINFLAFVFMVACYIVLCRSAGNKSVLESENAREKRKKQSAAIHRKLTRVLATDFLCWMPVCVMGFVKLAGIDIPNDVYLPTGLLILPINSVLNPFLYSNLPDVISNHGRVCVVWMTESFRRWRHRGTTSTHVQEAQINVNR